MLPLIALLLLRADVRHLGFQRGYHSWRVIAVWCFLPVLLILLNLLRGSMTVGYVATSLVGNSLRNGFFEEFLFRGVLLTRLSRLSGSTWGIVLSSLLFGFWHLGAALGPAQGNILVALAMTMVAQGMVGLGWAIAFVRTRNLLAPSVIHVLFNVSQL